MGKKLKLKMSSFLSDSEHAVAQKYADIHHHTTTGINHWWSVSN
jgi:hypothetical protein